MAELDGGAKPAIDVKIWLAAVLLVVGFLSGLGVANGRSAESVLNLTKEVVSARQTILDLRKVRNSSKGFILKVREQDQAAYTKALAGLSTEDGESVAQLAD